MSSNSEEPDTSPKRSQSHSHLRPPSSSHSHSRGRKRSGSGSQSGRTSVSIKDSFLAPFRDDLVLAKDTNFLQGDEGPFPSQNSIKFERVPPSEVGIRSNKWRKAISASLLSSSSFSHQFQQEREQQVWTELEDQLLQPADNSPPFWGIPEKVRAQLSLLSLQLFLHEAACFGSLLLLGGLIVRFIDAGGMADIGGSSFNPVSNRIYEAFIAFLLVLSSVGFLLRIDTENPSDLLTAPVYFLPQIVLAVCFYLDKGWELQKEECLKHYNYNSNYSKELELNANCGHYLRNDKNLPNTSLTLIFMKVLTILSSFLISCHLFVCRNKFYLIQKFAFGSWRQAKQAENQRY